MDEYFFYSLDDGSVLSPGENIPVSFSEIEGQSDTVVIRLTDSGKKEMALVEMDPDDLKGNGLSMALPEDLEPGLYYLQFEVWGEGVLLSESEVYFFISDGDFRIVSIETYPPNVVPGDTVTARVFPVYPGEMDPWLRWTLDGEVLLEGYLSEIGETVDFAITGDEGLYSLKGELFPVMSDESLVSLAYAYTDLFVSPASEEEADREPPENSEYSFYVSFDQGADELPVEEGSVAVIGNPDASADQEGYVFSSEDGIVYQFSGLPLDSEGSVSDFSLHLDFTYEKLPLQGEWRLISIGSAEDGFVLFYNGTNQMFYAGFSRFPEEYSSVPLSVFPENGQVSLTLEYAVQNSSRQLIWLVQDEILHETALHKTSYEDGEIVLGSDGEEPGLPLLWLSAGITEDMLAFSTALREQPESEHGKYDTLYARTERDEDIKLEIPVSGSELATLEILLQPYSDESMQFLFSSGLSASSPLQTFHIIPEEEEGQAQVVFSIINSRDGLFISHDGQIKGPFLVNSSLIFEIEKYNTSQNSIDSVKEIRLYQD